VFARSAARIRAPPVNDAAPGRSLRTSQTHSGPSTARPGPARRHWDYAAIETLGADATITPLAAPSAGIRGADLLP
jgi:hypothetical protein